ncbi:MAG TPA: hypothetical protein VLH56_11415 [Dissulfurispiraceae bacterium]|nr:hypothetical protein [Dissulfurispiraceae bacterium]
MKKTIIASSIVLLVVWFVMDLRNRAILDEAERDAKRRIEQAEWRYSAEAIKADGLAAEVQRLLDLPEKIKVETIIRDRVKTEVKTEVIPGSLPDVIIGQIELTPRQAFPGLAAAIDRLIESHYILRSEHDAMVSGLRDLVDVKQKQLDRTKWGWTIGVQGGVTLSGSPYIGFGGTWGRRL